MAGIILCAPPRAAARPPSETVRESPCFERPRPPLRRPLVSHRRCPAAPPPPRRSPNKTVWVPVAFTIAFTCCIAAYSTYLAPLFALPALIKVSFPLLGARLRREGAPPSLLAPAQLLSPRRARAVPSGVGDVRRENHPPSGVITSCLSFLLVFRTNNSYGRFDEARKLWGSLVNRGRDLTRQARGGSARRRQRPPAPAPAPGAAADHPRAAPPARSVASTSRARRRAARPSRRWRAGSTPTTSASGPSGAHPRAP